MQIGLIEIVRKAPTSALIASAALILAGPFLYGQLSIKSNAEATPSKAAKKRCLPKPHPKKAGDSYYTGPLIDSHFHIPPPENGGPPQPALGRDLNLADIVCTLKAERTKRVFAFFPVYPDYSPVQFLQVAKTAKARYPNLFVRFIMPPGRDDVPPTVPANKLKSLLERSRGIFQGYGEIGLYELEGRRTADQFPPDAPIFQKIYTVIKKHKLMVYLHPGEGHVDNLERVLQQHPDIKFLVHGEQIEGAIGELMSRYPNIFFTVNDLYGDQYLLNTRETKNSFMDALKDYGPLLEKDVSTWKPLIEAHPGQFMWGTDRGDAVWTFDKEVGRKLADYGRSFIAQLKPSVQRRFAYKNAERLIQDQQ